MALYPLALYIPSPNHGGPIRHPTRLGVIHIMEGYLSGTDATFSNPANQVSAHFGVGKDGTTHQYVDTTLVAWAEASYNDVAISIEHEGFSGQQLTGAQIAADVKLIQWINTTCGTPIQLASSPTATGWLGHGQLGVSGGNHPNCPGQPILNQLPAIITAANKFPTPPTPTPTPVPTMIAHNSQGGGYWCVRSNGAVYAFAGAPYLGPLPKYLTQWGIGTSTNPIVGIADDGAGGYVLETDPPNAAQPALYHIIPGNPPPYTV